MASIEPGPLYKGSHEHTFQIMVVSCSISRSKSKHRQWDNFRIPYAAFSLCKHTVAAKLKYLESILNFLFVIRWQKSLSHIHLYKIVLQQYFNPLKLIKSTLAIKLCETVLALLSSDVFIAWKCCQVIEVMNQTSGPKNIMTYGVLCTLKCIQIPSIICILIF